MKYKVTIGLDAMWAVRCTITRGTMRVAYGVGVNKHEAWSMANIAMYNQRYTFRKGADASKLAKYNARYGTSHKLPKRDAWSDKHGM
jgi:hypothetical protein